jgi:hypothetical protein
MSDRINVFDEDIPHEISPVRDNVLVRRVERLSEYQQGEIEIPDSWVDKSPNQAKYGIYVNCGDINPDAWREVFKDDEMRTPEKTAVTKKAIDRECEPGKHVFAFSRGRHLPLGAVSEYSLVKLANVIWMEPYDPEEFGELNHEN